MSGVLWAAGIWAVTLGLWYWLDTRAGRSKAWLNRESVAVILALLGTKAIAANTSAEEILRDPAVIERIVRGGLAALALLVAVPILIQRLRNPDRETGFRNLTVVVTYLGVLAVTTLYSAAPLVTGAKALEMGAGTAAVLAAAFAHDGRRRLRDMAVTVVVLEAALLIASIIGFFALPETFSRMDIRPGFLGELIMRAPWAHSNYLSAIGALVASFALAWALEAKAKSHRIFLIVLFLMGISGTVLASGRQGVIILLASVSVLLWFRRRVLFTIAIGPAIAVTLWLNWESAVEVFARGRPENLLTLTGRVGWWQSALDAWVVHPWTGYGFGAGGRFVALANIGRSQTSNVHSGYVETLVGVGLLGAIPLLLAVVIVAAWSLGALRDGRDVPFAIIIVPMAIHTSVAQGFGGWLNAEFVLLVCLVGITDWWRRDRRMTRTRSELVGTA